MPDEEYTFVLDGETYVWDGHHWFNSVTRCPAPAPVVSRLKSLLNGRPDEDGCSLSDLQEVLANAKEAKARGQRGRACELAERAVAMAPDHEGAVAVFSSALRAAGRSDEAVTVTDAFVDSEYPPLLTSRAAALCDLEMWDEARAVISKARAMVDSEEVFSVMRRIEAGAPETCD